MASCPLVRNRVQGQARDQRPHRVLHLLFRDPLPRAGQAVAGLLPHVGQVHRVDPVRDPSRAAHVLALHARGAAAVLSWPVSSSVPTVIRLRQERAAASSSRAAPNLLTWLIAAASSHDARFSRRCIASGNRSPACSATDQPFREARSLTSAFRYFPACSHVWVRAKHDRSTPSSADRSRSARPAPIVAAAAALDSFASTST
jgi:hypothetical protein